MVLKVPCSVTEGSRSHRDEKLCVVPKGLLLASAFIYTSIYLSSIYVSIIYLCIYHLSIYLSIYHLSIYLSYLSLSLYLSSVIVF